MKRLISIALGMLLCGCQANGTGSSNEVKADESVQKEDNSHQQIEYDAKEADALKERMIRTGELPPITEVAISVKSVSDNLSATDADRAKLFANQHVTLCYQNALAGNVDLTLSTSLSIKIDGTGSVLTTSFDPAIEAGSFADCLNKAAKDFRLPKTRNGAEGNVVYEISFKAKKAPSMGEIVKQHKNGDDHHHH